MHNSPENNASFNIVFCENNLRYLLQWQPLESEKIEYMKSEIVRLQKLLSTM